MSGQGPIAVTAQERAAARDRAGLRQAARPGLFGRAIDGAIREVAPNWARRRQNARTMLALGDGYEVAESSRHRRGRHYGGGSADRHLEARTHFQLREICRDGARNSPLLGGIVDRWADNVVGPTFNWAPQTADEGWNEAAREYIEGRADKTADLRRRQSFRSLARTWMTAVCTDGDCLIAATDDGWATYEGDQLVTPDGFGPSSALLNGRTVVNGVHLDPATGRPLGYYVAGREYRGYVAARDWSRAVQYIPAEAAVFPANLKRSSQTRGVPILANALGAWEHLDGYLNSEQIAAEVASCIVLAILRSDPSFFVNPETQQLADWVYSETAPDGTEQQLRKMEPGQIVTGALGDKIEVLDAKRPGQTFEPYVVTALRLIGAGIGMPLELVLLDFSRTNYSSARASLLQAYRTFRCWQRFAVEEVLDPIYRRWIGQGIAEGDLPVRGDAFRVRWLMPRWAWLDPYREVLAAERATAAGFDAIADRIEEEGQTLAEYVRLRRRELEMFREAGIPTSTAPLNLPAQGPAAPPAGPQGPARGGAPPAGGTGVSPVPAGKTGGTPVPASTGGTPVPASTGGTPVPPAEIGGSS